MGWSDDELDAMTAEWESEAPARRAQADQAQRAAAIANRQTWIFWIVMSGVIAVVCFSTNDSWGNERPLGVNLLLALVVGPLAAGVVAAIVGDAIIGPLARRNTPMRPVGDFAERYGERHRAERAWWAERIRHHGGVCAEDVCVLPSRRIERGAFWHLAHDHARGGAHDYLGPAHPECNQAEALRRGVTWKGAPSLSELTNQARAGSDPAADDVESDNDDPWAAEDESENDPSAAPAASDRATKPVSRPRQVPDKPWATPGVGDDVEPPF